MDIKTDQIIGTLIGAAVGDALGAPYEFTHPPLGTPIAMTGGGSFNWAPGEWTDDTSMTVGIALAAAEHDDISRGKGLDAVAKNFQTWFDSHPPDVGTQTASVLSRRAGNAVAMTKAARTIKGRKAGNGSLMRTSPVALATLNQPATVMVATAKAVSALTHADPDAYRACELWSYAIRHAITHGDLAGPELYLQEFIAGPGTRARWEWILKDAERGVMPDGGSNFWVVGALAAAWYSVTSTSSYVDAVRSAIYLGGDTDTVASIAGALAGALYGVSTIPPLWRTPLHGYPGLTGADLEALAVTIAAP